MSKIHERIMRMNTGKHLKQIIIAVLCVLLIGGGLSAVMLRTQIGEVVTTVQKWDDEEGDKSEKMCIRDSYYYCKNTVTPTGHECSFRLNIEQTEINKMVAKIISAMVNKPRFVEAIKAKIGTAVDTVDMEKQLDVLKGQLKQAFGTKSRIRCV